MILPSKKANRPAPVITLPSYLKGTHYIGPVYGIFVQNSNQYNILPRDAEIDPNRVKMVGYIFDEDVLSLLNNIESLHEEKIDLHDYFEYLTVTVDETKSKKERLLSSIHKERKDLPEVQNHEISKVVSSVKDNEPLHPSVGTMWLEDFACIILGCQPSMHVDLGVEKRSLVGYWDEIGQLHFLQTETMREVRQDFYSLKIDVFSRNTGILESDVMLEKGALFIGCGSVGSLVAVELAKAGVGRFMLVDHDIFGYHNICRHQCGIYDVGRYKTDAVEDRILQINPYAKIIKKYCPIQDVDVKEIYDFCDKNTIIVGGADNREGDLYANQFAVEIDMPFISIGCWERAFAGEIFYSIPSQMPSYKDFMAALGDTSGRVTQNRRFYTTEADLEKVSFEPGISADINFVTIIAVKLILDLLNRNTNGYTQRLLPYLSQYTLVCNTNNPAIGGEQAMIFSYPLQVTTSISVPYANE